MANLAPTFAAPASQIQAPRSRSVSRQPFKPVFADMGDIAPLITRVPQRPGVHGRPNACAATRLRISFYLSN
jgi:hypothetical protein